MLTKEQRKQALDAYRTHCTGIVSDYEWPAEDAWLFCWDLATQAAVVRVVPEDSLAQPYADPMVPSFTGISTEAPALGEGWMPIGTAPKGIKVLAAYKNELGNWRRIIARYYRPGTLEAGDDDDRAGEDGYVSKIRKKNN